MLSWEFWLATEVTGSGDVASGVSVAGQASETFAAAGAVATPSVAIAGVAAETLIGSGAVAVGVAISGEASTYAAVTGGRMLVFVPSPEEADAAYARRERDRKRHREKVRAEAQAVITVAMAAVLDHQRQLEEDDWLLGLADVYVTRRAA